MVKRKRTTSSAPATRRPRRPIKRRRVIRRRRFARLPRGGVLGNLPRIYKLRYCEWFSLSSVAGGRGSYTFRANGLYDPNQSGVGNQPFLHDTLATLWNKYVVLGSRINFSVLGLETAAQTTFPCVMGVVLDDDNTISGDYRNIVEQSLGRHRIVNNRADVKATSVIGKFSAKRFFGVKDVKDNTDHIGATFGSDPSQQAYFICWFQTLAQALDTSASAQCMVVIDYIVHVSEPKTIAQS